MLLSGNKLAMPDYPSVQTLVISIADSQFPFWNILAKY